MPHPAADSVVAQCRQLGNPANFVKGALPPHTPSSKLIPVILQNSIQSEAARVLAQ